MQVRNRRPENAEIDSRIQDADEGKTDRLKRNGALMPGQRETV
jgi:hypothetical protein